MYINSTRQKTVIVFSCAHADPSASNNRFLWLGELIYDINPNYVVDLGDCADMRSLNSYDGKYPQAVVSQNYQSDIECYNDAQEKLRHKPNQRKYKRSSWIGFEGNHENRIKKPLHMTLGYKEIALVCLSTIYKRITGLMSTMNILTRPLARSL